MQIAAAGCYGVNVAYYAVDFLDSTSKLYQGHSSSERVQGVVIDARIHLDLLFLKFYW